MMIRSNSFLKVQKSARLTFLRTENDKKNNKLLLVLHGYGQLSTYFSRKFEVALSEGFDVLVPEGLHRFYNQGNAGRVGASWMTKEERETDIQDNLAYIDQVISSIQNDYTEIHLLGFSQGGATAARYYCENPSRLNGLILWASVFPPDIESPKKKLQGTNNYFVLGAQDEFFSDEKQKEVLNLQSDLGMQVVKYEGKHDIDPAVLQSILVNI